MTIALCSLQSHPGCGLQRGWRDDEDDQNETNQDLIKVRIGDD